MTTIDGTTTITQDDTTTITTDNAAITLSKTNATLDTCSLKSDVTVNTTIVTTITVKPNQPRNNIINSKYLLIIEHFSQLIIAHLNQTITLGINIKKAIISHTAIISNKVAQVTMAVPAINHPLNSLT